MLESEEAYVIFSWYPVTEFHSLIIPKRHVADQYLYYSEILDIFTLKAQMISRLNLQDYNFGVNNGSAAGQTVFHCHYHLIPRSKGDSPNPQPRGGIRNVIPSKGAPDGDPQKELVAEWTKQFKKV